MAARPVVVLRSVLLAAPAADVWAFASTPAGVNAELMPLVRMTIPVTVTGLTADDVTMGEVLCHSWLLAGGVVPFDRHALGFESIGEMGFVEESTSWVQRRWRHERTVTPVTGSTCRVTDRLTVVPRVPLARPLAARVVPLVFEHRHRRLVARWGEA